MRKTFSHPLNHHCPRGKLTSSIFHGSVFSAVCHFQAASLWTDSHSLHKELQEFSVQWRPGASCLSLACCQVTGTKLCFLGRSTCRRARLLLVKSIDTRQFEQTRNSNWAGLGGAWKRMASILNVLFSGSTLGSIRLPGHSICRTRVTTAQRLFPR